MGVEDEESDGGGMEQVNFDRIKFLGYGLSRVSRADEYLARQVLPLVCACLGEELILIKLNLLRRQAALWLWCCN